MLKQVDEYELDQMRGEGGVYAFHLRAIRRDTVGLGDSVGGHFEDDQIEAARERVYLQLAKMLDLERSLKYVGRIQEEGQYRGHEIGIRLDGELDLSNDYLYKQIDEVQTHDFVAFVDSIDRLSTFMPPLYVGITVGQSLKARYEQHRTDHRLGTDMRRFGARLADAKFEWTDIVFSVSTKTVSGLSSSRTIKILENYIQFLSRPKLGRS